VKKVMPQFDLQAIQRRMDAAPIAPPAAVVRQKTEVQLRREQQREFDLQVGNAAIAKLRENFDGEAREESGHTEFEGKDFI